ncbi:MAG: photosynthetic complex putative assembly protein PuhB [Rhodobacteraceae bacterium]|nr:photosynthetic complex putative assembly protein PuhB [Paracoccaceae bacterium]
MSHDDFAVEPVRGLPERPPEDEKILWQGRPAVWALARSSLLLPWVAAYFVGLALWRFGSIVDIVPLGRAVALSMPFLVLGAVACALLWLIAFVQARATVYTLTNKRVAMRIGAALTVTLNLPYTRIDSADLELRRDGTGTIALTLQDRVRIGYLMLWPHVRPWRAPTRPALRCIPDARRVAAILAEAAEARVSVPQVAAKADAGAVALAAE